MAAVVDRQFGIFRRIWLKIRYGAVAQECLERMGRLGFKLELFYLFVEDGLSPADSLVSPPPIDRQDYETGFLGLKEMMAVAAIPGSGVTEKQVLRWFNDGRTCFGAKQGGEVVSYVWCNFRECQFLNLRIPLKPDEAYLFNTQTRRSHRGQNLAAFVRSRLYRELAGRGLIHFYSVVSVFNRPSLNVKMKLGARKVKVYFHIGLMNKWRRTYCVKTFEH